MTDQLTLSLFSLLISNLNLVNIIFLSALSISVSFGFFSLSINICVHIPKYQKKKKKNLSYESLGFSSGSFGKESASNARDAGSIPGLRRSP